MMRLARVEEKKLRIDGWAYGRHYRLIDERTNLYIEMPDASRKRKEGEN